MKIKSVLFVAAVCVLAALTSCGGLKSMRFMALHSGRH